ncbi:hypothetical protein [Dyella sp. GSA-30]|uniref:hypothetical protein n=1 Tax=Dyella sp. GSA-30 TaxID=2994496 RepID=UPI0024900781|nr:hypothetical protein [Dyella sp. GSA-30]BDU22563.1 hypothetical protein DYGSA30_40200 [Dyella sp. GSA-30]
MQRAILLGLVAVLVAGCGDGPQDLSAIPRDPYPNANSFFNDIKDHPYKVSAERVARIIEGVKNVHRCMTKEEVSRLLGAPDYSDISYGPKGPNEKWLGSRWMFYASMQSDAGNMKAPRVEVFFDTTDRAHWIVPTGIEGANEIGTASVVCTQVRST